MSSSAVFCPGPNLGGAGRGGIFFLGAGSVGRAGAGLPGLTFGPDAGLDSKLSPKISSTGTELVDVVFCGASEEKI